MDINTRNTKNPYDYFNPEALFNILKHLIAAGQYICTVKNGRHGDIRPKNIIWDGVKLNPFLFNSNLS